jgi:hypothetical protein
MEIKHQIFLSSALVKGAPGHLHMVAAVPLDKDATVFLV